ncbi:MAG: PilN domain-containing protein [Candidatus Omnitrophica bacterium]|nr:PilN domain-containing protein [Candidatus Omnitrophota bacterium]
MIQINLLPEELRVKTKTKSVEYETVAKHAAFSQDQLFVYAIPVMLVLFILAHFYFAAILISKNGQLVSLNRKWLDLAAQKKSLDEFNQEFSATSQDASLLQQLNRQRFLWAEKLNVLSLRLPAGVWFNQITINAKDIIIHGSVISLQKEEVNLVNKLLENLKADSEFFKDFVSLELSNVQKRSIGGYDVADFILTGVLKAR